MILVFGAGGLLGSTICKLYPHEVLGLTYQDLDVRHKNRVFDILKEHRPDAVINCAGITPRSPSINKEYTAFRVNAEVPWTLSELCTRLDIKLIHMSTDCVFSGTDAPYTERSTTDARDLYGMSKAKGEFIVYPHLVIRGSFVGFPDPNGRGLLSRIADMRETNGDIPAYSRVLWNGVTVDTMADILMELARSSRVWGIRHIFGADTLTKQQVLGIANKIYQWGLEDRFVSVDTPVSNRCLSSDFSDVTSLDYYRYTFAKMVARMRKRLGDG